jgi:hypothetical protein
MSCSGLRVGGPNKTIDKNCLKNCLNMGKEGAIGCSGCYDFNNYVPKQQQLAISPFGCPFGVMVEESGVSEVCGSCYSRNKLYDHDKVIRLSCLRADQYLEALKTAEAKARVDAKRAERRAAHERR